MTDLDTIKAALIAFHKLTDSLKYGGLRRQHELAKAALEAMERVGTPPLPGLEGGSDIVLAPGGLALQQVQDAPGESDL